MLLAGGQLPFGRADLSLRQSAAEAAADARGCEAHVVGTLGHDRRQNFIYVHLNRVIKKYHLNMIDVSGPGVRHACDTRDGGLRPLPY